MLFRHHSDFKHRGWHAQPSTDVTPPTITVGPAVGSITDSTATVTWTTSEAATGQVGYGLAAPSGTGAVAIADSDLRTGTSVYVSIPKASLDIVAGDLVIIAATKCLASAAFSEVSPTSGWTFVKNVSYTGGSHQMMFVAYKVISSPASEPASWEFTRGSESQPYWAAVTLVLRDVAAGVVDATLVYAEGIDDLTPDAPDITTATAGALVLTGHHSATSGVSRSSVTPGAPSTFTMVGTAVTTWAWTAVAQRTEAAAGAKTYGAWTHSPDNATDEYQTWTLAITPSVSGGGSWDRVSDYTSLSGYVGTYATNHSVPLSGLAASTTYHYAVESLDAAGNLVVSSDGTFATTTGGGGVAGGFPTSQTGLAYVAWGGSIAEPGYLVETADPNFEGSIQRISPTSSGWRTMYPKAPTWNADETAMFILSGSTVYLLDGQTYANLGSMSGIVSNRTVWSATDPRYAWTTWDNDNRLYRANPQAGTREVYRQFGSYTYVNNGLSEGRQSNDDRYHALYVGSNTVLIYDATADTYRVVVLPAALDHCGISPSGAYMVVRYANEGTGAGQGVWAYDRSTGQPIRNMWGGSHYDVCLGPANEDMLVGIISGAVRARRISDNASFDVAFGAFTDGHVSGNAHRRPGWVTLSNHYNPNGRAGEDQIISVKLDGSLETQVWCHARTVQTTAQYQYELSTFGGVSPTGSRVVWGGGWERSVTGDAGAAVYVVRIAP